MQAFNTWAFKREQPSDPKMLLAAVARSVLRSEPVPFVMYWGKGPRCRIDAPDIACLDHLAAFAQRIGAVYEPGAAIKLILTDTHAQLNGHLPRAISRYFADIDLGARQHGFETCWLGDLTRAAGPQAESDPAGDAVLTSEMLAHLAKSAMKWYRGEGTAEDGARTYYRMNMVERRAVEIAFPDAVFMTFNGSNARWLFPNSMPIFYMYSLRRGFSVKPWFLPAEAMPCDAASCRCATPAAD
jgi:L-tyrosine isonitrile synthase